MSAAAMWQGLVLPAMPDWGWGIQRRLEMLVLTCRVGGTLRIGRKIHITLQGRLRDRITVALVAPADAYVVLDNADLKPLVLPSGARSYLFSLLSFHRFRVGEVEVGVWVPDELEPLAADCTDFIHIGVVGPGPLRIGYEQEADGCVPVVTCFRPPMTTYWH